MPFSSIDNLVREPTCRSTSPPLYFSYETNAYSYNNPAFLPPADPTNKNSRPQPTPVYWSPSKGWVEWPAWIGASYAQFTFHRADPTFSDGGINPPRFFITPQEIDATKFVALQRRKEQSLLLHAPSSPLEEWEPFPAPCYNSVRDGYQTPAMPPSVPLWDILRSAVPQGSIVCGGAVASPTLTSPAVADVEAVPSQRSNTLAGLFTWLYLALSFSCTCTLRSQHSCDFQPPSAQGCSEGSGNRTCHSERPSVPTHDL